MSANSGLTPIRTQWLKQADDGLGMTIASPYFGIGVFTFTGTSSYDTAGSTLDVSKYYVTKPDLVMLPSSNTGYLPTWVAGTTAANGKVKVYTTEGTEVASTTDLSSNTFELLAIGGVLKHP